jgi:hypothetical protein
MAEAVTQLSNAMKAAQIPELNVIISPGTESVMVPNLTLRNIRGADALQLIAASASCQMDSIPGQDNEIIGYRVAALVQGVDPFAPNPGFSPVAPPVPAAPPKVAIPQQEPPPSDPTAGGGIPGGSTIMTFGAAPAENVSTARVYPLGTLTTITKFNDVEETLREVFKAGGIASADLKLALHENTNVLIVKGNQRVHEAVKQLLDALEKNTAAAEVANRRGDDVRREVIQMQVRLDAEQNERARLMKQLDHLESQRAELSQELERFKAARPK